MKTRSDASIYSILLETTLGTLLLIPAFLGWLARATFRRLAAFDWTLTRALRSDSKYWWIWSRIGDGWAYAAVVLWLLKTGQTELAGHISACIVLAWGGSALLKITFRRRRPPVENQPGFENRRAWRYPSLWSFPSQHAACAAAFWMSWHPHDFGITWGACLFGIAWSRIACGSHFVSDVLAGVAVGVAAGVWG